MAYLHCLEMTSFEQNWNEKYPEKFPLMSIENQWIDEIASNFQRENNVNSLPFKNRMHEMPIENKNNENTNTREYTELQLLTEEDRIVRRTGEENARRQNRKGRQKGKLEGKAVRIGPLTVDYAYFFFPQLVTCPQVHTYTVCIEIAFSNRSVH
jgi:hypothetical protein